MANPNTQLQAAIALFAAQPGITPDQEAQLRAAITQDAQLLQQLNQDAANGQLKGFALPQAGAAPTLAGTYDMASGVVTLPATSFQPTGTAPSADLTATLRVQDMSLRHHPLPAPCQPASAKSAVAINKPAPAAPNLGIYGERAAPRRAVRHGCACKETERRAIHPPAHRRDQAMTRTPPNIVSFAAAAPRRPDTAMAEAAALAPPGEHAEAMVFGLAPDALTIIQVAVAIEPDPGTALAWFRRVCIEELGGFTAEQLVLRGQSGRVMAFLTAILRGERG